MSITERIFTAARGPFGKDVYKAWPQVAEEFEHALWRVWNPRHGPLTEAQVEYACELICHALRRAEGRPNVYASYKVNLRGLLNHERVDEGFKARRASLAEEVFNSLGLGSFQEVSA